MGMYINLSHSNSWTFCRLLLLFILYLYSMRYPYHTSSSQYSATSYTVETWHHSGLRYHWHHRYSCCPVYWFWSTTLCGSSTSPINIISRDKGVSPTATEAVATQKTVVSTAQKMIEALVRCAWVFFSSIHFLRLSIHPYASHEWGELTFFNKFRLPPSLRYVCGLLPYSSS